MIEDKYTQQFEERLYFLSEENIMQLNIMESGAYINNVVKGLEKEVYFTLLKKDNKSHVEFDICYINGEQKLRGFVVELSLQLENRNELVFIFSKFLSQEFRNVDFVDTYNEYQNQIISLSEKIGYWTHTEHLINMIKGKKAEIIVPNARGVIFISLLDKLDVFKSLFGKINDSIFTKGNKKIYLMYNSVNKLIKIGESKNPEFRERTLQAQEPDVHLIAAWEAPVKVEKDLHNKFKNKRLRGEWFKLDMKDLFDIKDYMENLNN